MVIAIAHFQSKLHKLNTVGIDTIAGIPQSGVIHLTKNSRLRIRLPVDQVRLVYSLAGKTLRIGKHTIRLAIPDICLLRFLFDFSPDSLVLRWTHDFSPRFLYCFQQDEYGNISAPELLRRVNSRDINPEELWIGGSIAEQLRDLGMQDAGASVFPGVKEAVNDLKKTIVKDLRLLRKRSSNDNISFKS